MTRFAFTSLLAVVLLTGAIRHNVTVKAQSGADSSGGGDLTPLDDEKRSILPASINGCSLFETQYTLEVEEQDACGTTFIEIILNSGADVNLYVRRGQRVAMEEGQIVSDYKSDSQTPFKSVMLRPPYRGGTYYIAVANCGAEPASFALRFALAMADYFGPVIRVAEIEGKKLRVSGCMIDIDAVVLLNGQEQATKFTAEGEMPTLVVKKGGKKIKPGETVYIQVKNSSDILSPPFSFTRAGQ
jgi:hypothetical protein